jgi:hypothetical protein
MKSTMKKVLWTVGVGVAVLCFCTKDNPAGPTGTKVNDYPLYYTVSGNKIIVSNPVHISSYRYCFGDSLVTRYDTSEASADTSIFEISGNTLRLIGGKDTLDTSKAVFEYYTEMTRVGGGDGIVGTWALSGYTYRIVSGTPTAGETIRLDNLYSNNYTESMYGLTYEYEITGTEINLYIDGEYDYAASFIETWNGKYSSPAYADSAWYAISVQKLSKNSVQLTGSISGEVVSISWSSTSAVSMFGSNYSITYTSSNAAHQPFTYYTNPQTCPNNSKPSWWTAFRSANAKPGTPIGLLKQGSDKPVEISANKLLRVIFNLK